MISKPPIAAGNRIYIVVFSILILKLVLLPFSQTVDADALSRIHLTQDWMSNPKWIDTSVWAPFHFYLNGFMLWLWNDVVYAPKVLNLVLSSCMLIPFYFFSKREFNANGALIATIMFGLTPILFRNSFMALSGTPYLFFIVMALNLVSKSLREDKIQWILLGGIMLTIASGFRYEAWLLMFVLGVLILFIDWKKALVYGTAALVFPIIWMISNWKATGDPFYSIQGNYRWTMEIVGNNDNVNTEAWLRRIWFFPFSWFISVGPPAAYLLIKYLGKSIGEFKSERIRALWSILFLTVFAFFIYNSLKGTLLLHHRFVGTLVALSLPFIALKFVELNRKAIRNAFIFTTLMVGLSFVYNNDTITPLPRLKDQKKAELSASINNSLTSESGLILDFIGWDYTYYYALRSKVPQERLVLVEGEKNSYLPLKEAQQLVQSRNKTVILIHKDSPMREQFFNQLNPEQLTFLEGSDEFDIYLYTHTEY